MRSLVSIETETKRAKYVIPAPPLCEADNMVQIFGADLYIRVDTLQEPDL